MKLANRQAGYLSSLDLIHTQGCSTLILLCEASATAERVKERQAMMKETSRKRRHHLRVPVLPEEKIHIEQQAKQAGMSVARYLREVGQGYQIKGVTDYQRVRELARINGDLGRLGGLLKLWLTDDVRTAAFGPETIHRLLARIEATQDQMTLVMRTIVRPQADQ